MKIIVFIWPSNSFSVWITLIMGELLLNLVLCEENIWPGSSRKGNRGKMKIIGVWMALKRGKEFGDRLLSNFPPSSGIIPARGSPENCVTEANNWKITASSLNDPQYTEVILLCLNTMLLQLLKWAPVITSKIALIVTVLRITFWQIILYHNKGEGEDCK